MALADLSLVTSALMRVFTEYVEVRLEPSLTLNPTPRPPDDLGDGSGLNTLSVYLHHVEETADSRVYGAASGSNTPVRQRSMGLTLRYLVTAHHTNDTTDTTDPLIEQKLLGYAAKTVHDFPVIDDATHIDPSSDPIFAQLGLAGSKNVIRVVLLKLKPEDALSIFGTNSGTPPPALFLEVGVVELEREVAETTAGLVTAVGGYLAVGRGPFLDQSRSTLTFMPPAASGVVTPVQIARAPAQVTVGANPPAAPVPPLSPDPDNHRAFFVGGALGGNDRRLEVVGPRRRFQLALDVAEATQPQANQFWHPRVNASTVAVSFHRRVHDALTASVMDVLPGIHTARVLLFTESTTGGDPVMNATNAVSIAIAPEVRAITPLGPRHYRFDIDGDYLARPPAAPPPAPPPSDFDIQLSVGGEVVPDLHTVTSVPHPPAPPAGQPAYDRQADHFLVWLRPGGPIDDLASDHPLAIRLIIDGAEAPPRWLEAP